MSRSAASTAAREAQGNLFEPGKWGRVANVVNGTAGVGDPASARNKALPVHRWVPWIAGFSSDFVTKAIEMHLERKSTVLDPFAGVGTTLLDALLSGHDAVGFEINPYAVLACRTKLNAHSISLRELREQAKRFMDFYDRMARSGHEPRSKPPRGFRTRAPFYSARVLRKVLIVQDFIQGIDDVAMRDLLRVAFASTMVSYSNYSYEPSLGRRASADKADVEDHPVGETIQRKLADMADDILWLQKRPVVKRTTAQVIDQSFFQCQSHLAPESADLAITSPPYLNNYHYNRNTRPHLYWLGFARRPGELQPLEQNNFGKFWQTVREEARVDLDFALPGSDIRERLGALRSLHPEKGVYGGNGWANYAASYFNDCNRFAQGLKYTLKRGGSALIVVGNSILQGIMIPTDRYLASIAERIGLELVRIEVPRPTRVGNSIIRSSVRVEKARETHQLYEAVVELRKP